MKIDRRVLKILVHYKSLMISAVVFNMLTAGVIVVQAWIISRSINEVFLRGKGLLEIVPFLYFLFALIVLRAVMKWCGRYLNQLLGIKVKTDMRNRLMSHITDLGPAYTRSENSGELHHILTGGIEAVGTYISDYTQQLLLAVIIPLLILFIVFPMDWLTGLIFMVTAPLIPFFMILIGDVAGKLTQKQWTLLSRMSAFFLDAIQGMTTLKLLDAIQRAIEKIVNVTETFRKTTMRVLRVGFLSALALEWLSTLSTAIIAVQIGLRVLYGRLDFTDALFVLIIAPEFYQPLRRLGARFHAGMKGFSAAQRYFEITERKPLIAPGVAGVPGFHTIQLNDISYTYPNRREIALDHITLCFERGEKVALIGPSGAGKTTLLYMICRFMDPLSGYILLGNRLLKEVNPDEWRKWISWVPQHPFLFYGSIMENIRLARPGASDGDVFRAIHQARLDRLIAELPNGADTPIGERGKRLSGGQAQRLALARAFLKDAPLLLFDEPTSHLDAKTEAAIHSSLQEWGRDKTLITIVHRPETLQYADRVIVLFNGKLHAQGTFQELGKHPAIVSMAIEEESLL